MTIKEIAKMTIEDVSKMKKEELFKLVKDSRKLMNYRLTKLNNFAKTQNIPKPIVLREWGLLDTPTEEKMRKYGIIDKNQRRKYDIEKSGGIIIEKNKLNNKNKQSISYLTIHLDPNENDDINALRYKFKHIQNFLKDKSSTVEGWKSVMNNFYSRLLGKEDVKGREILGKVNYRRFWEIYNKVQELHTFNDLDSTQIQKMIYSLRIDENMSMNKIEEFLLSNSRIDIETSEDISEDFKEKFYGGYND